MNTPTFTDFLRDQNRLLQDRMKENQAEIEQLTLREKALAAQLDLTIANLDRNEKDNERLSKLLMVLIENDPNDMAADGITVLDVWRKDVCRALGIKLK